MQLKNSRALMATVFVTFVLTMAAAEAGQFFRLDIGPPFAAGVAKTKDGSFAVRALACDEPAQVRMTGTAEGIVNGQRQSVALKLISADTPGVFLVSRQWPDGAWVVNLTGTCPGRSATAAVIVPMGPKGFDKASSTFLDRAPKASEIDAALKALSSQSRS
jgi:hypothetical protein